MKRYITEAANHKLSSIPEGPGKDEARDKIEKIIRACKAGLITDLEAVYLIARPGYAEQ